MVVRKEIYKKCRDVCLSMASFMGPLNLCPTNIGLPQGFNFNFTDKHLRHFYMGALSLPLQGAR